MGGRSKIGPGFLLEFPVVPGDREQDFLDASGEVGIGEELLSGGVVVEFCEEEIGVCGDVFLGVSFFWGGLGVGGRHGYARIW